MEVLPVPYEEVKVWILSKHYAHRLPSISYSYGLYDGYVLKGVVTYGVPASPSLCIGVCGEKYKDSVLELNRLVVDSDAPKNSASYLVGRSLKMLPRDKVIVSYADTGMGHIGYIYQATNWVYTGATAERTDVDTGENKHSRHYEGMDMSKRKLRTSKHRYVFFRDKKARRDLKYPILPYPKGESKRYESPDIKISTLF